MVSKLTLCAILATCLALGVPAWAGTLQFQGTDLNGQGALSFTPGMGNDLTIGAGNGGSGALITDLINNLGICGGDCGIMGGYLTLTTGGQTGGSGGGGSFTYTFGAGGSLDIFGKIPSQGINNSSLLFSATFLPGAIFTGAGQVGSYVASLNLASIFLNPNLGTYNYGAGASDDISFSLNPGCSMGGMCTDRLIIRLPMRKPSRSRRLSLDLVPGCSCSGPGYAGECSLARPLPDCSRPQ